MKLINEREVLQKSNRNDVCVGKIQSIDIDGNLFEVSIWYQNGNFHHVGTPKQINKGTVAQ